MASAAHGSSSAEAPSGAMRGGTDVAVKEEDLVADTERHPSTEAGALSRTLDGGDLTLVDSSHDASADEDELADPLIGLVVADRYRITERIGRGGMGIVYRVEHVRIGKVLAMKLLAGELSANKEVVRRFKLEALTVSKLSSPHTVQVFDYGVWNHLTYLVMELVEGCDLAQALREGGPIPFARLGRLMVQVCASLAEAHDKGIVHRDIKPENIMIITDSRGVEIAKVLDFGLAKLRESSELNELTLQGAVVGTPYYMSPEQVHGEEVDGRTDVYSLGAVMFRALTGTYPFDARSPMGMFTKHLTEEPPAATERAPELDIPEEVSDLTRRCMSKEPERRFQSVIDLRDALVEELGALPSSSSERLLVEDSGVQPVEGNDARDLARRKKAVSAVAVPADLLAKSAIATREELERYERKLRRNRYGAWTLLGLLVVGGLGGALYAYRQGQTRFDGQEREPNDQASLATPLPLGRPVKALLGRRPEPGRGDRDFFRFEVPEGEPSPRVSVDVSALPNIPMCTVIYRVGFAQPLAQYCMGRPGQDLHVGAVRLEPGSHFLVVHQDRRRGAAGHAPPIHENVSDPYQVTVALAPAGPDDEIEPNDGPASAQVMVVGGQVEGTLGWAGDEDVFCVAEAVSAPVVWEVSDQPRAEGTVLEATPSLGETDLPMVRVHRQGASAFGRPRLPADVTSPWRSTAIASGRGARCLRLRLTSDPWTDEQRGPSPDGAAHYRVRLVEPDEGAAGASPQQEATRASSSSSAQAPPPKRPATTKARPREPEASEAGGGTSSPSAAPSDAMPPDAPEE